MKKYLIAAGLILATSLMMAVPARAGFTLDIRNGNVHISTGKSGGYYGQPKYDRRSYRRHDNRRDYSYRGDQRRDYKRRDYKRRDYKRRDYRKHRSDRRYNRPDRRQYGKYYGYDGNWGNRRGEIDKRRYRTKYKQRDRRYDKRHYKKRDKRYRKWKRHD